MDNSFSISRYLFNLLQRLMFLWVRTSVQGNLPEPADADAQKPVIYVLRSRSLSDLLVLDRECRKAGLPRPYAPLKGEGIDEPHAYFFLSKPEGLILQRERVYNAPRLQRLARSVEEFKDSDVQIVPVSIFWGRRPDKEQSAFKLLFAWNYNVGSHFRKLLAVLFHGRQTLVHFNAPLSLRELVDEGQDEERTLRKIHRILRVHFRQLHTSVNGPDLSHRRTLVDGLIESEVIQRAIQKEMTEHNISQEKAYLRARKYANEIVSDYSHPVVRFMDILLTWFWNKIYSGVEVNHIEPVRELAKNHEIVYLPCHRSHIDYLLLSYLLYYHGLQIPHIAAGINLNMPLVGSILRRGGAFFIRRSFKGNPLYSTVFHEYLHTLFTRGFPTEFFIEGGRSRTGRTLKPKTGMLSIMLRSYLRSNSKPLALVPVYIGYEKVLEAATYMGELRGKEKKKESPLDIFRTLAALKENFGHAHVNFGKPVLLNDFLNEHQPDWKQQTYDQEFRPEWLWSVTDSLGTEIASQINTAAAINSVNMLAMALLNTPRQAMGDEELAKLLDDINGLMAKVPYSDYVTPCTLSGKEMIKEVESLNMVVRQSDSLGDIISTDERNSVLMTYYRNNILHLLAIPSFICRLFSNTYVLKRSEIQDDCARFYPYMKAELFLRWDSLSLSAEVDHWLQALTEAGLLILIQDGDEDCFRRPDSSSTAFITLTVVSRAIQQTLERYFVVISLLLRNGSGQIDADEMEKQSQDMSQRLSILHGLNAPEFFDKNLFRQFIEELKVQKILDIDEDGHLTFDNEQIAAMAEDSRRLLPSEERHSIRQVTWNKTSKN
ncbi:glycerol-3-phosphate 1-O-acyltransferase PlsB [Parendozoicomonas haliclonae]|uniref:Glycerol-3-phosphate acyltransferase n=1 Tax=Parendozoicomonas haliclonae TaxID=1960125 RepID=A0A1X7AQR3_9GAMM|nr:glycerol-3-phosphate 1-O-acyltransferase PlsB [Parendozoicomonas haliclonae]SMA50493.1 Glycerol-3-phosphate acyltransferase [Parendozoicomonas haliclonae]